MLIQLPLTFWHRFPFFGYENMKKLSAVCKETYKIVHEIRSNRHFLFHTRIVHVPVEFQTKEMIGNMKIFLEHLSEKWIGDNRKTIVSITAENGEEVFSLCNAIPKQFYISIRFTGKENENYDDILSSSLESISSRLISLDLKDNDLDNCLTIDLSKCLKHAPHLEQLSLESNCIYSEGIDILVIPLSKMANLRSLNISGNKIGSKGSINLSIALENMKEMNKLDLSRNDIGALGFNVLAPIIAGMNNLELLNLGCNWFGANGSVPVARMIEGLAKLKDLNLEFDYISSVEECGMSVIGPAIQNLSCLVSLNLAGNRLGTGQFFNTSVMIASMTQLKYLDISVNTIRDENATSLARPLSIITGLTHLNLSNNMITQTGAVSISTCLKKMSKLKSLDISNNEINDFGIDYLLSSVTPYLQSLDISSNNYTHVESIRNISLLTNLLDLKIRYNDTECVGSTELVSYFSNMFHLTSLDITGNSLRNNGLQYLIGVIKHFPNMRIVKLCCNSIGDQGVIGLVENIKSMPSLVELDLSWNQIHNSVFAILESSVGSNVKIIGRTSNDL